jgi:hypothetical protein
MPVRYRYNPNRLLGDLGKTAIHMLKLQVTPTMSRALLTALGQLKELEHLHLKIRPTHSVL